MQCVRGAQWKNMKEKQVKCTVTVCFTHLLAEDTMQLLRAYESLRMLKSHSFLLPPDRQTQTCVICVCVFDQCPIIYVEWLRRRFVSGVEISSLSLACLFRYFFFFICRLRTIVSVDYSYTLSNIFPSHSLQITCGNWSTTCNA